jgi:alpha-L-fucosidase
MSSSGNIEVALPGTPACCAVGDKTAGNETGLYLNQRERQKLKDPIIKLSIPVALLCLLANTLSATDHSNDTRPEWFRDAKFGLFVHWGLYSVPAGQWGRKTTYHEWFQLQTHMSNEHYGEFAAVFNPVGFDARQWVKTAKEAGMKYIVITAKHADGFCMFDTTYTDYNIVKATPFKRDPMKELAQACREAGIKLCFFYSLPDWHHPEMPAQYNQRGFHGDLNPNADVAKYIEYTRDQVKELLTHYGPVGSIWFDGGTAFAAADRARVLQADKMVAMIHQLQPDCLINNRLGAGGDYTTPERRIPARTLNCDFEVCMTLNDHWGYNKHDNDWKSAKTVIRELTDAAGRGGNFLLNVGATAEGTFPQPAMDILERVGKWMAANGESVYGTRAGPFLTLPWGNCTMKTNGTDAVLYLHVFDWPADGKLLLPGLRSPVQTAYLLANKRRKSLTIESTPDGPTLHLPAEGFDPIAATIVMKLGGALAVESAPLKPDPNGVIELPAFAAILHGDRIRFMEGPLATCIGYWQDPEDWLEWPLEAGKTGKFLVSADAASKDGGTLVLTAGDRELTADVPPTGDYYRFKNVELGTIELTSADKVRLQVKPVPDGWHAVNLKTITLKPSER